MLSENTQQTRYIPHRMPFKKHSNPVVYKYVQSVINEPSLISMQYTPYIDISKHTKFASFGIICTDIITDPANPRFLMVERSTSVGFTCITTGQFSIRCPNYMRRLMMNCTREEVEVLAKGTIEAICNHVDSRTTVGSYEVKVAHITRIDNFNYHHPDETIEKLAKELLLDISQVWHSQPELEFPKGRRQTLAEPPVSAAVREFVEEVGLPLNKLNFDLDPAVYYEMYTGIDNNPYSNLYYFMNADETFLNTLESIKQPSTHEIYKIHWFTIEEIAERTKTFTRRSFRMEIVKRILKRLELVEGESAPRVGSAAAPPKVTTWVSKPRVKQAGKVSPPPPYTRPYVLVE